MSRRALEAVPEGRTFDRPTVRLLLRARRTLAVAAALAVLRMQASANGHRTLAALIQHLRVDLERLEQENRYLRDRLARIPPGHRSRYTPVERFRILTFVRTYGLSVAGAAARFLVTPKTIARWFAEATAHPDRRTIGSLLRAVPPIRRYADVVRDLVQEMDVWGFGGNRRIAHTLARAGVQLGRETVRRYRTGPRRLPTAPRDYHGPLVPSRPNHVWLIDLTTVRRWLGLVSYQILVVLDGYSRLPLAARVFTTAPRARDIARVFRRAVRAHGAPRVLMFDRAKVFR